MKGIKVGILGITVALAGICFSMNNVVAMGMGFAGVILAIAGFAVKD